MSITAALYSGVSGINANGDALGVAGDNIANQNTPGFKSSAAIFESALTQQLGSAQVGLGSQLAATAANFSQGNFANSSRPTDLAIDGEGFFIVNGPGNQQFYTRAGSFSKDGNANLVTAAGGFQVLGYTMDPTTQAVGGTLGVINFSGTNSTTPASQTTKVSFSANLDSNTPTRTPGSFVGTSFSAAQASSDFNISTNVYDSLGNPRTVTTYFRHIGANQWSYHVLTLGTNLANADPANAAGSTVALQEGLLTFNTDGSFNNVNNAVTYSPLDGRVGDAPDAGGGLLQAGELINKSLGGANGQIQWAGGAAPVSSITFDFGGSGSTAVMTQNSGSSAVTDITENGGEAGVLQSIDIAKDGTINGTFSNGTTRGLYKIALATFPNPEGLSREGENLYGQTSVSGIAQPGLPTQGGKGQIKAFEIEQSNVDLASEFVKIITYQRAFQASARTVSTAADMLQDLVRLGQ